MSRVIDASNEIGNKSDSMVQSKIPDTIINNLSVSLQSEVLPQVNVSGISIPSEPIAEKTGDQSDPDKSLKTTEPAIATDTSSSKRFKSLKDLVVILLLGSVAITLFYYLQSDRISTSRKSVVDHSTHSRPETNNTSSSLPAGTVQINPDKQQLIGVQYGEVEYQNISKQIRAAGRIAYDETMTTRINPKIEGWIEHVYVDYTGKYVQKGQPLISIYSPDLVQTQREYLLALKGQQSLDTSEYPEARRYSASLVESAKRRLQFWDISDAQIAEIEKRGEPVKSMILYAPASGFVDKRNAYPQQRVTPDTELYTLIDLSNIWVMAEIYEYESSDIKVGQVANVEVSSLPGRTFRGKVSYIYPQMDNQTRTIKARIELPNPNYIFKPDMFADVQFQISRKRHLVVPQEAVLDAGTEQIVFVALGEGYFEPRKVQVGERIDNKYVVLAGLKAGERIVTSGNFLIDSESKLRSGAGANTSGHSNHTLQGNEQTPAGRIDSDHNNYTKQSSNEGVRQQTTETTPPSDESHANH
jgi:membrane fusion protein, copper/silver efflux system